MPVSVRERSWGLIQKIEAAFRHMGSRMKADSEKHKSEFGAWISAAAGGSSAEFGATIGHVSGVSAAVLNVFLPPPPLCSSLMDRRLELCYLPDPLLLLLSLPHHSPLHHTQKNTHLQLKIASFTHRTPHFKMEEKRRAKRSAWCRNTGRTPRAKAAPTCGINQPPSPTPSSPLAALRRRKFPRVKNKERGG